MKKLFTLLTVASLITFTACKDEVVVLDSPSITVPTGSQVQVGTEGTLSFTVSAPGKIATATASASDGTATVVDAKAGETSTTIDVTYTAGTTAGNQTVTLTVTDAQSPAKSSEAVATIEVTEEEVFEPVVVTGALTSDATWTADRIWILGSKVVVEDGVTLTIEPGTIIKGKEGAGSLATGLIVARGGKLMAEGTAMAPIIFTTEKDDIKVGELMGSNLDKEDIELWGGLIILGKAPISAKNGDTEAQIEGIPADDTFGLYGGSDASDNSGSLKYVSVRHGGALIGEGNEINGITLGGVGSGTTMDYIEIYATLDDGIEFFGGTVDVTNVIISHQGDDGLDIDQNYAGTVTNFLVQHGVNGTDEGLEIDGPEGSTHTDGLFTLKDGTIRSLEGTDASQTDFKSKAQGTIENIVYSGYSAGKDLVKIAVSYTNNCADAKTDAFTHYTADPATLKIVSSNFNDITLYTKSEADDASTCPVKDADKTAAEGISTSDDTATGADITVFENWTIAALAGEL